jgi:hypothetical protein
VVSVGVSTIEPVVELVNINAREYNINSKAGVPLIFTKSENVTVITVIVGDDVLEFDNLDSGDLCGIIIPHNVFKNIGKYNIKIFPFSLDDYENEARPKLPRLRVDPKSAEIRFNSVETLSINTPTSTDKFNPYNLNLNTTSNGVGATTITNNRFNNTNLGSVGSLLNANLDNTNIR